MPPLIIVCSAFYGHRAYGENGGGVEQRSMVLPTIKAMAQTDAVGLAQRHQPHITAETSTRVPVQARYSPASR